MGWILGIPTWILGIHIMGRHRPDHLTGEPMDEGFGAIVMNCKKLRRLAVSGLLTDSTFSDSALLSGLHHYYNMRFLWMSSCKLSLRGCKEVAQRLPRLVVEVIRDSGEDDDNEAVEKLYMDRSLAGSRNDALPFVEIL